MKARLPAAATLAAISFALLRGAVEFAWLQSWRLRQRRPH